MYDPTKTDKVVDTKARKVEEEQRREAFMLLPCVFCVMG